MTGAVAVVTGASGGLGWRFSKVLAAEGYRVALAARRVEKLRELEVEIAQEGGEAACFAFDAENATAPDRLIDEIVVRLGMPAILINNAGVSLPGRAHEASLEAFDCTFAVNLRTPWRLSQIVAKHWIETGTEGAIVNLSSVLSQRVEAGLSLYTTSKAAIRHMTAAHALEWARYGIRVNALCPGYVRTEINDTYWDTDRGRAVIAKLPRRRVGRPEDLDSALLFLIDPRSGFVNGEALIVDDAQGWAI